MMRVKFIHHLIYRAISRDSLKDQIDLISDLGNEENRAPIVIQIQEEIEKPPNILKIMNNEENKHDSLNLNGQECHVCDFV